MYHAHGVCTSWVSARFLSEPCVRQHFGAHVPWSRFCTAKGICEGKFDTLQVSRHKCCAVSSSVSSFPLGHNRPPRTKFYSSCVWTSSRFSSSSFVSGQAGGSPERALHSSSELRSKDDADEHNSVFVDPVPALKINQDILVFQARQMRNRALKTRNRGERVALRLRALQVFDRAKRIDPSDGRAYVGMAQILKQLGDISAARKCYQDGCDATGGDNAYIWQAWATLEEKDGNVVQARKLYDAATAADKTHAAAWHGWGMFEKGQGNFQRARDLFVKGVRLVPQSRANPHLYQSLGVMAAERGRVQEAREHFREGTRTEAGAQSAALWQAWAVLEAQQGHGEVARKLFQRGLQADPENRYVWLSWAVYEAQEGYIDRARRLLIKGRRLNPGDPPLLQALARLEATAGNIDLARTLFEQGSKLDPLHQANWQAWALAEWKDGHVHRARELFQRGVWVAPQSRNACRLFHAWGTLEEREGNISLARQLYKCGVKADQTSEMIWLTWAAMEESQQNDLRAAELRNLCVQQRAEDAVGQSDLSPAAMFGIDSALRPILRSLATLLSTSSQETIGDYIDGELARSEREVVQAEQLFGTTRSND